MPLSNRLARLRRCLLLLPPLLATACGDGPKPPSEPLATALDDTLADHARKHRDPARNMGVRTARVERAPLQETIRTLGRVQYDEARLAQVHPRAILTGLDEGHESEISDQLPIDSVASLQASFLRMSPGTGAADGR